MNVPKALKLGLGELSAGNIIVLTTMSAPGSIGLPLRGAVSVGVFSTRPAFITALDVLPEAAAGCWVFILMITTSVPSGAITVTVSVDAGSTPVVFAA